MRAVMYTWGSSTCPSSELSGQSSASRSDSNERNRQYLLAGQDILTLLSHSALTASQLHSMKQKELEQGQWILTLTHLPSYQVSQLSQAIQNSPALQQTWHTSDTWTSTGLVLQHMQGHAPRRHFERHSAALPYAQCSAAHIPLCAQPLHSPFTGCVSAHSPDMLSAAWSGCSRKHVSRQEVFGVPAVRMQLHLGSCPFCCSPTATKHATSSLLFTQSCTCHVLASAPHNRPPDDTARAQLQPWLLSLVDAPAVGAGVPLPILVAPACFRLPLILVQGIPLRAGLIVIAAVLAHL